MLFSKSLNVYFRVNLSIVHLGGQLNVNLSNCDFARRSRLETISGLKGLCLPKNTLLIIRFVEPEKSLE